jgi:thiopeptide-type bacteriocin biosynthesis protein
VTREFEPSSLIVLRTPLLPAGELAAWSADLRSPEALAGGDDDLRESLARDRALLRGRLQGLLERPEVREALFLASPDLTESLKHWRQDPDGKKGQRAELGLVRYLQRMASRSTPFGLFSGCTPGGIGDPGGGTRLRIEGTASCRRHSRLDMDYLFALCEHLGRSPEVRGEILYRPNSSLYEIGGRLRYAEARLAGRLRTYHLVALPGFDALGLTLERAAGGTRLRDLAEALVADSLGTGDPEEEVTLEEALSFLHDLVDNQVLFPDLALPTTGEESTPALLRQLSSIPSAAEALEHLAAADRALSGLDERGLGSPSEPYREIARGLEPLGVPVEMSRLFQVDMVKPEREVVLGQDAIDEILRGIDLLHRVGSRREDPLDAFRSAFRERYGEGREVPLFEVLDEESGIGFDRSAHAGAEASPLLSGLLFRARGERTTTTWSGRESTLLRLLSQALAEGRTEVELTAGTVERLQGSDRLPLPDAFHAMVSLAAESPAALERGDFRVYLDHAGGPSGARLLGRFCHADERIRAGVEEHLAAEESHAPGALFAEVVHLPGGRVGNVLSRPVLRAREIPFLGVSGAPREHQIPASDLLVTVNGDRVRLRSKSLGPEILPRLSTAHNFSRESLGVYRFLGALQGQGRARSVEWTWGPMAAAPFLPRVTSGRLVLCRAQWRLLKADLEPLTSVTGAARYRAAQDWRRERNMPRHLVLADGDNELLVDFLNPLSLDAGVELLKSRDEVTLTEVFPSSDELCAESPEGRFFHELLVPFVRRPAVEKSRPVEVATVPAPLAQRTFAAGAEWLYAKIYTGTATADVALCEEIAPLAREAVASGAADRWFFLRYSDTDWHLRVRFHGEPARLHAEVLPRLEAAFARLLAYGSAWKCQLDTYEREIERYGGPEGIGLSEELFHRDSEAVVELLEELTSDAGADERWRLTLIGMDRLLRDFGLDLEARLRLAERGRAGFAGRYRYDELLRTPIADRLRKERGALARLLDAPEAVPEPLLRRSAALAGIVKELRARESQGRLRPPVSEILTSYVHMFVNRMSRSAGPEHELVLYDFLVQLYGSQLARERKAAAVPRKAAG